MLLRKTAHIKKPLPIVFHIVGVRHELLLSLLHRGQVGGLFLMCISSDLSGQRLSIRPIIALIEIHTRHGFIRLLSLILVAHHDVSSIGLALELLVVVREIQLAQTRWRTWISGVDNAVISTLSSSSHAFRRLLSLLNAGVLMLLFTLHEHQLLKNDVFFDSFVSHGIPLLIVFRKVAAQSFRSSWCMRDVWHITSVINLIIVHLRSDHFHRSFIIRSLKEIVIFLCVCLILLRLVNEFSAGCSKLALNIFDPR